LWGLFLIFSKVQGDPSFRHNKDEFARKQFKGLHGSFEDLKALQFQEDLRISGSVVAYD